MTAAYIPLVRTHRYPMGALLRAFYEREPIFAGTTIVLMVAAVPMLLAYSMDQRTLLDINVWVKPLKFELALIVYFATLVLFAGWLPEDTKRKVWFQVFSWIVVGSTAIEMAWIVGAAANGIESHFNVTTPFMAILYGLMGPLAVVLTSATLVYGFVFLRDRESALTPVFRYSLAYGLIATFILTCIVAGTMAGGGTHFVGGSMSDAGGFPLMGWSRDGGDLRVPHFFATHAMHFVPLAGFMLSPFMPRASGRTAMLSVAMLFAVFTLYTFVEALMGQPFLSLALQNNF